MAIYRTASRRPLILTGVVAALVGAVIGFGLGSATAPSLATQLATARAEARPILTSLEVVRIEYESLLTGGDSGSPDAIARAQEAFRARRVTFELLDPDATARLDRALAHLVDLVAAKAPTADVEAAVVEAESVANELAGVALAGS